MLFFLDARNECTGCTACQAVCPVDCITFNLDNEGFYYPTADSRCINCGRCEKVCPLINKRYGLEKYRQYSLAGRHKDDQIWQESSSGGAFSAICEVVYEENGVIFGAKYDGLEVVHDYVENLEDIRKFRKSKYVQSNMRDCFRKAKNFLSQGRQVIFSGTPCQIAGLRNFIGKEYDNLFCIDLVCHGVSSPGIFKRYIVELEQENKSSIKSFTFRQKNIVRGNLLQYIVSISLVNGEVIESFPNLYNTAFIQTILSRPSCEQCHFANIKRVGDITIADFKKKFELLPNEKSLDNLSTIIINSSKGEKVASLLSENMTIVPIELDKIIKTNTPLRQPSKANKNRSNFFYEASNEKSIIELLKNM